MQASQHKRGMRRRCLQFEEAHLSTIANSPNSSNPTNSVTKSRSPATHVDLEIPESSCVDLTATSSNRKLVNLPQPISNSFSPRNSGNSPLKVSKPSGIGLHLNRIVSAVPITFVSVQRLKTESITNCHLTENVKTSSISSNTVEEALAITEVGMQETKTLIAASSSPSESCRGMKPLNNPVLLKPTKHCANSHDKRKSNSEHSDSFDEFNQPSPRNKR